MGVRISALVCTYNRSPYLLNALQSLDNQTLDSNLYEVIVVDNASTDETKKVFGAFGKRVNWHYIYDPVIGLSHARNTGWQTAEGDYVALMDDDAVAKPDWLAKFLEAFDTLRPQPGGIGGRCIPIWEIPQPDWLSDKMLGILSVYHYADAPSVINEGQGLSACNIAYPKSLLQWAGGFCEDLGRKGSALRGGEEAYLQRQMEAGGYRLVYHPEILVSHHISASRLTKRWFRQHAYWQGKAQALIIASIPKPLAFWSRVRLTLNRLGWAIPRFGLMIVSTKPSDRFRRECQLIETIGFISGLYQSEKNEPVRKDAL
jgi:glucosyl-dolichyl phosphate glucuronosyltransferase